MGVVKRFLLGAILVLGFAAGLIGCGDDDNPAGQNPGGTDLVGTWVRYAALHNGVPDPNGGAYGTSGHTITVNADGTGSALDVVDLGPPVVFQPFTWTRAGDVVTVIADPAAAAPETVVVSVVVAGNTLTIDEGDGSTGIYQRHLGATMLLGTWDIVSVIDDNGGGAQPVDPGDYAVRFEAGGTWSHLEGGIVTDAAYTTSGAVVTVGPDSYVYTVVGPNLYAFEAIRDQGLLLIHKFVKV